MIMGPASGTIGEVLSFSGSNSTDNDGSIVEYLWDFGDGTEAVSGMDVTYSYSVPGSYQITLTVTDNDGLSNTITSTVIIT